MAISPSRALLLGTDVLGTITGVTTGTSEPVNCSAAVQVAVYLASQGTTSGGTILIEEADWDPALDLTYAGTWVQVASVSASAFTGGAQSKTAVTAAAFGFFRARISAAITGGGTITAALRMR